MLDEGFGDGQGITRACAGGVGSLDRCQRSLIEGQVDGEGEHLAKARHGIRRPALIREHDAHPVVRVCGDPGIGDKLLELAPESDECARHGRGDASHLDGAGRRDVDHRHRLDV